MSNALITTITIAVAGAITAGLLVLAGVGDEDSQSRREAEAREQRINTTAQQMAADIVREFPTLCDEIDQAGNGDGSQTTLIAVDASYFAGLSETDIRALSNRVLSQLRALCPSRGR